MRGIGRALIRLPAAAALIAGAALFAGGVAQQARAQTPSDGLPAAGDVALAIPPLAEPMGEGVALPQPLAPSLAARLRRIFALQAQGDLPAALRATARLDDPSPLAGAMLGHILADRYLGPYARPDAAALRDWLERWPDLPDAPAIHRLLLARLPKDEAAPAPPALTATAIPPPAVAEEDDDAPEGPALHRNPDLDRTVADFARHRGAAGVLRLLRHTKGLSPVYAAQLRGEAARILFTLNRDEEALALAKGGVRGCGPDPTAACAEAAEAGLVAGLAAWRLHWPALAAAMFEAGWRAERTTPTLRAACAFWAGRAHLRLGEVAAGLVWLRRAAELRHTFYGALGRRRLGWRAPRHGGEREVLGEADVEAVAATGPGLRAFALLQLGQEGRASAELRLLWPRARADHPLARAVMLVALRAGLPDVAAQFADLLPPAEGRRPARPRIPLPPLRPVGGFRIDPAMLYGLARTESDFDPRLISRAGARGILQIMPETARDVAGHDVGGALYDVAFNLDLGQRYIAYLAEQAPIGGNLIRLLASYNAGPGAFARWGAEIRDQGDPLLFIEAIPIDETRAYVPRVLAYTWMYAEQLRLPAPSLDELAAGEWPRYHGPKAPLALP